MTYLKSYRNKPARGFGYESDDRDYYDDYWKPNYVDKYSSSSSILDKALEHDLKTFGSFDTIRIYDKSIDYP